MCMDNPADQPIIVDRESGVTLLGGVETSQGILTESLQHAPTLVAADGGLDQALALGHVPAAVIGDLDSASPAALARMPPGSVHRVAEQESTDFEKALSRIRAPFVIATGFRGGRFDHELAVLSALLRHRTRPVLLLSKEEVVFHAPPRLALKLAPGMRVSLFPLLPVEGRSRGLRWPIDDLVLAPGGRVGTSNEAAATEVHLEVAGPGLLVLLPREALGEAVRVLAPGFVR